MIQMAKILYTYKDGVYANLTNLCNCRCTFCVRFQHEGIGDAPTLWHKVNPTWEQVKAAVDAFDFTGYKELVFCGYGEPTCALDLMLQTARYVKKIHPELKLRVDTNGLGNLENKRDIVPVYFDGKNSNFFYNLARIRKALGIKMNYEMIYLPDEMFRSKHKTFRIHFGKPIPWQTFDNSKKPAEWAEWIKNKVYKLKD